MLQAMQTDHPGSMTTVHANDPGNAISRLRTMVGYADGDLNREVIMQQIAESLSGGLIVHVERLQDGNRRVTSIVAVDPLPEGGAVIPRAELFAYDVAGSGRRTAGWWAPGGHAASSPSISRSAWWPRASGTTPHGSSRSSGPGLPKARAASRARVPDRPAALGGWWSARLFWTREETMVYLVASTAIVAVCAVLAARVIGCVREERLAQRAWAAPAVSGGTSGGPLRDAHPARRAAAGQERDTPLGRRLCAAGVELAPRQWIAVVAGAAVLAGACACAASGVAAFGAIAAGAVPALACVQVRQRARKRSELLDVQLAHALPQIAASLRSSLTLERALRVGLVHMDDPLHGEIARVLADATYGTPLHEALEAMARRTQSEDVRTLASAARMRQGSGGSVAAALALVSSRVNARLKAARELKVEVAGTRLAKWFVAGAMPAIFLIMYAMNADFARFYTTEPLGWAVLGAAAVLEAVGLALAHAVTSLDRR